MRFFMRFFQLKLDELEDRKLRSRGILDNLNFRLTKKIFEQTNKESAHCLTWPMIPFPFSIGIIEVDIKVCQDRWQHGGTPHASPHWQLRGQGLVRQPDPYGPSPAERVLVKTSRHRHSDGLCTQDNNFRSSLLSLPPH
jgi:hypothetical protein